MIQFLNKHIDKLAHFAVGTAIAFIIVVALTLLNSSSVVINVTAFLSVILIAFWKEMKHDKKADEFDIIATVAGAMAILIIYNYF